jgi:hypothetical protein
MKQFLIKQINRLGYTVVKKDKKIVLPSDFEGLHQSIVTKVQPYTMTSPERIFGLVEAVKYITRYKIEGDIVECGVWKGGSMLATAETLLHERDTLRGLFLYDTFEGMPPPSKDDVSFDNRSAEQMLEVNSNKEQNLVWAYSTLESVKQTMALSAYPPEKIQYIKGKIEDTIPGTMPEKIALLRLDTDWYESTKHELIHLFPRLVKGGVLIIDDYGYWKGARKAVDEFIQENAVQILLNRLDETGRIAVKQ